jgi:ribosomal-protein-alanine N-acetyltransferase
MTTIATERLVLRPLRDDDADALVRGLNNLAVTQWTARIPHPYGPDDAAEFLKLTREAGPGILRLAIDHDGGLIGVIGLELDEIGYWLAAPHWGQGFGTEAARAVTDHAFESLGRQSLVASYRIGNAASRRILLGLGFEERGPAKGFCRATNAETDVMNLGLSRAAWTKAREQRR